MPPMLYCIVIVCCGPTEYEKRLRSDTHQTLIICCGAMDRIDSFLAFSRIFHPKWMKIICHATGARLETIIGVRHPSQVSSSWSLLFRFVDTDTHILSFGLRLSMKMKVASESKSDLHIRTIGIGQESAHKHIQLRRNTFLQTYFFQSNHFC